MLFKGGVIITGIIVQFEAYTVGQRFNLKGLVFLADLAEKVRNFFSTFQFRKISLKMIWEIKEVFGRDTGARK